MFEPGGASPDDERSYSIGLGRPSARVERPGRSAAKPLPEVRFSGSDVLNLNDVVVENLTLWIHDVIATEFDAFDWATVDKQAPGGLVFELVEVFTTHFDRVLREPRVFDERSVIGEGHLLMRMSEIFSGNRVPRVLAIDLAEKLMKVIAGQYKGKPGEGDWLDSDDLEVATHLAPIADRDPISLS